MGRGEQLRARYVRFVRGNDFLSRCVSYWTGSFFTHVDLVIRFNPREFLGALPGQGVVLHDGGGQVETEAFVKLPRPVPFYVWARELGKPYDWMAILRSLVFPYPNRFALDTRAWYCTELVAYLAAATGVQHFRGIITPDALLNWLTRQRGELEMVTGKSKLVPLAKYQRF